MSYKNLAVQKKIAVVFSAIGVVMVTFAFFLLQELNKVESEVINFTDSTVPSVLSVEAMYFEMSVLRRSQYASLTYKEYDSGLEALFKRQNTTLANIKNMLASYDATVAGSEERRVFDEVLASWKAYSHLFRDFPQLIKDRELDKAHAILVNSLDDFNGVGDAMDGLVDINLGFVSNNRTSIMSSVDSVTLATKVSFSALIAFMIFITFFLARQICRPLNLVVEQSKAIAAGDLTFE
ncbi:MCP four helix bundle domain-containing protein, partial [Aliivibrio fischeri]